MSARLCNSCRDWRKCGGLYLYFEPNEIKWCWHQVIWLIRNHDYLSEYLYPPDPAISDAGDIRAPGVSVSRETIKNIKSEFELRLTATGRDGDTLYHDVRTLGATWETLAYAPKTALRYMCGKRKHQKFGEWKSDREYYYSQKKHGKIP